MIHLMITIPEIVEILLKENVFSPFKRASGKYKVHLRHDIWRENLEKVFQEYPKIKEFCDSFPDIAQFIYCLKNGLCEVPKCPICGKFCKFETEGGQYYRNTCCNTLCQKEWKRRGCLGKYGVENPSQLDWVQKKKEQTCLENYGAKIPFQTDRVKNINKEIQKSKGKEIIGKSQKTMLEKYGSKNPSQVKEFQRKKSWRYYYDGERFDSKPELAYYIYLQDHNIPFTFHVEKLDYIKEGIKHFYYPDFKVDNKFIEIKGDHFFNEKGEPFNKYNLEYWWEKYNCMIENSVKILRSGEYKQYIDYITQTYGFHYLDQFKNIRLYNKKEEA